NAFNSQSTTAISDSRFLNPALTLYITSTITTGEGSTSPFSIGRIPLSGNVSCNTLTITPATITFNNAPIGQATTQTVTLTNSGTSTVSVNSISFSPANGPFTVTGATFPLTIA